MTPRLPSGDSVALRGYKPATDPTTLKKLSEQLEATRWAAHVVDAEWTLVWASSELKALLGTDDDDELGVGAHLLEAQLREPWRRSISPETELDQLQRQVPMMIEDTPGGRATLKRILPPAAGPLLDDTAPVGVPSAMASKIEFVQGDLPPVEVRVLDLRLGGEDDRLGVLRLYGSALPARVLALVGRGDQGMFERMARAFEPQQRQAAILFADLQASGELSRRLPAEGFFALIRDLTTMVDELVVDRRGLVGKHAGDGVTAFFTVDDLGSPSAAARTAIEAAHAISAAAAKIAELHAEALGPAECRYNLGLHWGERLYMGQVVTGGRIEVTALGAEVNEAARLEQSAEHGQILASADLIERLSDEDATAIGLQRSGLAFVPVAELDGASEKALRDAGELAVADLAQRPA